MRSREAHPRSFDSAPGAACRPWARQLCSPRQGVDSKTSPLPPHPPRFRLRFARVRLDAAREILAERGGRAPHTSVLTSNRGPHRRSTHVSRRRKAIQIESQPIPQKARVSATLRLCGKPLRSLARCAHSVEIRLQLRMHPKTRECAKPNWYPRNKSNCSPWL